jgi:O-antigen ligase
VIFSGLILALLIGYFIGFNGASKLIIAGLLGAVFLIITITRSWIAVAIFFALVPLEKLFVIEGSITSTMTKLMGAYLVFLVIVTGAIRHINDVFSNKKSLAMLLFGGVAIISVMASKDIPFSLPILVGLWLSIILVFVMVLMIRDTSTLRIATWALLLGGAASIISPILFQYGNVGGYELKRYGGLWGDQNEFAALLLVLIPLSIVHTINGTKKIYKIISVCIGVTLIAGLILTYSRGGYLALCVMMMLALVKFSTGKKRMKLLAVAIPCMIIAVIIIYYTSAESIIGRMETLKFLTSKESISREGSLNARYYFYFELTPKVFSEHPLLGLGLRQIMLNNPYGYVTHNTFFEVLTGTGLIGLIPFLMIIFLTWKELKTVEKYEEGKDLYLYSYASALEIGFIGYLFAGLFLSLDLNKMLWLAISISSVLLNLSRMKAGQELRYREKSRNTYCYNKGRFAYLNR